MADLYDSLESRDPSAREQALLSALPALVTRAMQAPGWAENWINQTAKPNN